MDEIVLKLQVFCFFHSEETKWQVCYMNLHKSLGWADKRTCNLVILPIQSNFTQESFLIVICMYLYACCIQKKVTYDLKELFL